MLGGRVKGGKWEMPGIFEPPASQQVTSPEASEGEGERERERERE